MTTRDREYQTILTELADVARRREEELSTAEQAYQDNAALAAGELARAEGEAAAADRWAGAAASQVLEVDREATRVWTQLSQSRGMRQLGDVPEPEAIESKPRAAIEGSRPAAEVPRQSPRILLARASDRIEVTVRPAQRRPLPRWGLPLLPVIGALVAGVVALVAAGLVTFGERPAVPGGAAIRLLGWIAFLVAPSAGVPVAALLAHRRDARLDLTGVGLTLLGGMVAAALLSMSFAGSR